MKFIKTRSALPLLGACVALGFIVAPQSAHAENTDGADDPPPGAASPDEAPPEAVSPESSTATQSSLTPPGGAPPATKPVGPDATPAPAGAALPTAILPIAPIPVTPPPMTPPLGAPSDAAVLPAASLPVASAAGPPALSTDPRPTTALSNPPTPMTTSPSAGLAAPPRDTGGGRKGKNRQFGAMLNVGLPEGVLTSFVYQPIGYVRLNAGLGFNAISPSLSVGVSGHPLGYSWGPSFGIDYGHYFEGDASGLVEVLTGPIESNVSPMKNVGYDYVNFRLGMEYGGERFVFFGRGGVSWIGTEIHALNELIEAEAAASEGDVPSTTSVKFTHDPVLSIWAPSLSFGMIVRL